MKIDSYLFIKIPCKLLCIQIANTCTGMHFNFNFSNFLWWLSIKPMSCYYAMNYIKYMYQITFKEENLWDECLGVKFSADVKFKPPLPAG